MLIDKAGTYLGYAPIHGVDESSGGYPQLVLQCEATHFYDEEVEDYVEVSDQELRAYLVLYGKEKKPLRNCEQVKKVFGWDGASFQALAEKDLTEIRFLFRVEPNTWDGETKLQVSWIDVDTASPTRQITSLDTKDLQSLDKKFGLVMAGKKGETKVKPKGAPSVPKASTKKADAKKVDKKKENVSGLTGGTVDQTAADTPPGSVTSSPSAPAPKVEEKTGKTTRDNAWAYIEEQIPEAALSADDRAVEWTKAIEKIHGGPDDDTLTPEEWFDVQTLIVSETIPF
ncbi:hypothetical protein LCGC14_0486930 [marine sediment metagenome]|uniref:Uncharacterized protein n=1 Tax=marine sediment metagenome TaxID=412755 RepID=A0A0F9SCW8_9ZZZZ